jgi:hypothetical protein
MTTSAVVTEKNNTVVFENKQPVVVVAGMIGPQYVSSGISQLADVDTTNLPNGSILIFDTAMQKWVSGNILQQQTIEAGQY